MVETVKTMLRKAIHVVPGTEDTWLTDPPHTGTIDMTNVIQRFGKEENLYSICNGVLGIITGKEFYSIPATRARIKLLKEKGYYKSSFYVPFSCGDIPTAFERRWQKLVGEAKEENRQDFPNVCMKICRAKGVRNIDSITLSRCFMIPEDGMNIQKPHLAGPVREYGVFTKEDRSGLVDERISSMLGTFTVYNGQTVFTSTKGETFLARGVIREELLDAGYQEVDSLLVPLSSGGYIVGDDTLAREWEETPSLA